MFFPFSVSSLLCVWLDIIVPSLSLPPTAGAGTSTRKEEPKRQHHLGFNLNRKNLCLVDGTKAKLKKINLSSPSAWRFLLPQPAWGADAAYGENEKKCFWSRFWNSLSNLSQNLLFNHLVGECWPEHCGPKSSETKSDDPSVDCRVPRWEDLGRISFVCLCFWSLSQPLCRRSLNQCQEVWCLSSGKVWKGSELGPKQNERPCFLQSAKIKVNVYHSLVNAKHFPFRYHPNHPSDISKEVFLDEIS